MKAWKIILKGIDDPDIGRKLKRILKPVSGVGNQHPCDLCGEATTWTINSRPVCPSCQGKYGFVPKSWLPDPCEVCSKQGEWVCGEHNEHSLCFKHRDAWFDFTKSDLNMAAYRRASEAERSSAWDKCFADFIQRAKAVSV